jgi:hypothetical protein
MRKLFIPAASAAPALVPGVLQAQAPSGKYDDASRTKPSLILQWAARGDLAPAFCARRNGSKWP